jgi:hypothetical protein
MCLTAFDWSEALFRVFLGFPDFLPGKTGSKIKMSIFS